MIKSKFSFTEVILTAVWPIVAEEFLKLMQVQAGWYNIVTATSKSENTLFDEVTVFL